MGRVKKDLGHLSTTKIHIEIEDEDEERPIGLGLEVS
jgi:hypothetical protein